MTNSCHVPFVAIERNSATNGRAKEGMSMMDLNYKQITAENLETDGYMYINCFWVSGQYKGQGHADQLLEHCIADSKAKGKKGLVILSSHKKGPFGRSWLSEVQRFFGGRYG